MGKVIAELSERANLPLSFIQARPDTSVSLQLRNVSVRQALEAVVARSSGYRYAVVADRLLVYPRDPKWEIYLDDVHLGPAPRVQLAGALAQELRRLPEFTDLVGPWVLGNGRAYTYQDVVSVVGSGSVVEILIKLLGDRPSSFLYLPRKDTWQTLSVSSRDQLESLIVTSAQQVFRHRGETSQLRVIGQLKDGNVTVDLTQGTCGTIYEVSDRNIITVSSNGEVTAVEEGEAEITVTNERSSARITLKVKIEAEE